MFKWSVEKKKWVRGVSVGLAITLTCSITASTISPVMAEGGDPLERIYSMISGTITDPQSAADYLELANVAIGQKDYANALKYLQTAREMEDPENAASLSQLWLKSGSVYILLNQAEEAGNCLGHALELDENSTQALLLRAQLSITSGDYESAVGDLERYMVLMPEDAATELTLAQLYESLARYADARSIYQKMADAQAEGNDAQLLNALRCGFLNGDYEAAAAGFEGYLQERPEAAAEYRAVAHFLWAASVMQLSRPAEAVEGFRRALDAGYDPATCYEQMVLCSFDAADFAATVAIGQEMIEKQLTPTASDVFYQRIGAAQMQLGDHEAAVDNLSKAIECNAELAGSHYYRGVSLLALGRQEEAIADFTQSIQSGFLLQYCYYNRGVCYVQLEDYDSALNDFEQTLLQGDSPELIQGAKDILWQLAAYYENQAAAPKVESETEIPTGK